MESIVEILDNKINSNTSTATNFGGGGILIREGNTTIYGNEIKYNMADLFGGGIYVVELGEVSIYGENWEQWDRLNSPPADGDHNTYGENKHGDNECGGANVFFRPKLLISEL